MNFLISGTSGGKRTSASLSAPMLVGKDGKAHVPDPVERRANALAALKLICESQVFFPHLELLLATQDAQGNFSSGRFFKFSPIVMVAVIHFNGKQVYTGTQQS